MFPDSPQNQNNGNSSLSIKKILPYLIILGLLLVIPFLFLIIDPTNLAPGQPISLDQLVEDIQAGEVDSITVRGGTDVFVRLDNSDQYLYSKAREVDLLQQLQAQGVTAEQLSSVEYREIQGDNSGAILLQLVV